MDPNHACYQVTLHSDVEMGFFRFRFLDEYFLLLLPSQNKYGRQRLTTSKISLQFRRWNCIFTTIVRFSGHPFGLLTSVSATAHTKLISTLVSLGCLLLMPLKAISDSPCDVTQQLKPIPSSLIQMHLYS